MKTPALAWRCVVGIPVAVGARRRTRQSECQPWFSVALALGLVADLSRASSDQWTWRQMAKEIDLALASLDGRLPVRTRTRPSDSNYTASGGLEGHPAAPHQLGGLHICRCSLS